MPCLNYGYLIFLSFPFFFHFFGLFLAVRTGSVSLYDMPITGNATSGENLALDTNWKNKTKSLFRRQNIFGLWTWTAMVSSALLRSTMSGRGSWERDRPRRRKKMATPMATLPAPTLVKMLLGRQSGEVPYGWMNKFRERERAIH